MKETRERLGNEFPISFRINGEDFVDGGQTLDQSIRVAHLLEEAGATCIHVSGGTVGGWKMVPGSSEPDGCLVYLAAGIKQEINIPVITVGKITDPDFADNILAEGKADLIAMGRALVADPELPNKAKQGRTEDICQCLTCRTCSNGPIGEIACTVNPAAGREAESIIP